MPAPRPPPAGVGNVRFEVAAATELPGGGYDLITFFDSLHDIGDPARRAGPGPGGARARPGRCCCSSRSAPTTSQDNLNPDGRMFYAVSTLACTPNAVSQRTATSSEPLGAQAGESRLRALAAEAGFTRVRRLGCRGADEPDLGAAALTGHDDAVGRRPNGWSGGTRCWPRPAPCSRDALAGAGQLLLISGEAGIGKTAVLAALVDEAGSRMRWCCAAICWEGDGVPPYWPWSQVLRASGLPAAELGEAGWLLDAHRAARVTRAPATAADAQFRLFEAVVAVLADGWPAGGRWWWCSMTCSGPTNRRCGCWVSWPGPGHEPGAAARRLPRPGGAEELLALAGRARSSRSPASSDRRRGHAHRPRRPGWPRP